MAPKRFSKLRLRRVRGRLRIPLRFRLRRPHLPRISFVQSLTKLPNVLTYIRIAGIPPIIWLVYKSGCTENSCTVDNQRWALFATIAFAIASFTDYVDGWLARRKNLNTVVGQFLDPVADKLLVMALLVELVHLGRLEPWLAIVLIAREMFINGLRAVAGAEGIKVPVSWVGKWKTGLQLVGLGGLILHFSYELPSISYTMDFHHWGELGLYGALVLSVWSAIEYTWGFAQEMIRRDEGSEADS
ncbi:MAG: CDP-diacylglycerol--glycerol-3-phosphate 3-phosphatidyltransferase [Myxococcales bacterium]|nr:CDP-diacylglycerol--glycerol-3-phosphate 3-phosphatidyltransferase [Myxococcales bacterium]